MDDLVNRITKVLPSIPPDIRDDVTGDLILLVLEGRIDDKDLAWGIRHHLPEIKRKYGLAFLSLDQPVSEDSNLTLRDVAQVVAPEQRCARPYCRNRMKPGNKYCSRVCALKQAASDRKKVDEEKLKRLHLERRLPREETAKILGVTVHGVNNVVMRRGLSRKRLPETCIVSQCNLPAVRIQHIGGWLAGNLCNEHRREKARAYSKKWKIKSGWIPKSPKERSRQATEATNSRWAKSASERAEKKAAKRAEIEERKRLRKERTHCANGHEWNDCNTYIKKGGGRSCRTCQMLHQRAYRGRSGSQTL